MPQMSSTRKWNLLYKEAGQNYKQTAHIKREFNSYNLCHTNKMVFYTVLKTYVGQ